MSRVVLAFDAHNSPKEIARLNLNLDENFVFLKEPFIGRFRMMIDYDDVMGMIAENRYPFAYVEWLLDNYKKYAEEDNRERNEAWKEEHTFANSLGDYSPRIILYRNKEKGIIVPPVEGYGAVSVDFVEFISQVKNISERAVYILEMNPRFRKSRRLRRMKKNLEAHFT